MTGAGALSSKTAENSRIVFRTLSPDARRPDVADEQATDGSNDTQGATTNETCFAEPDTEHCALASQGSTQSTQIASPLVGHVLTFHTWPWHATERASLRVLSAMRLTRTVAFADDEQDSVALAALDCRESRASSCTPTVSITAELVVMSPARNWLHALQPPTTA